MIFVEVSLGPLRVIVTWCRIYAS